MDGWVVIKYIEEKGCFPFDHFVLCAICSWYPGKTHFVFDCSLHLEPGCCFDFYTSLLAKVHWSSSVCTRKSDKIVCSQCVSKYLCVIDFPDGHVALRSQFIALNFPANTFASGHCSASHTRGSGFSVSSANTFHVFRCHQ